MKKSFKENIKEDFGLTGLLFIPICVAINIVGFQIAQVMKLPIFLDQIGTILIGVVCGPWLAIAVGILTNCINGIFNPVYFYYTPAAIVVGIVAAFCSRKGLFKSFPKVIVSGLILTVASVLITTPITVLVFGGSTGVSTGSLITAALLATGSKIWAAATSTQIIQEIGDKMISAIVVYIIASKIPARYMAKFRYGSYVTGKKKDSAEADNLYK